MRDLQRSYDPSKYKNKWTQEAEEEARLQAEVQARAKELRKEKMEKMLAYNEMVKVQHGVKASKKKNLELELLKQTFDPAFKKLQ